MLREADLLDWNPKPDSNTMGFAMEVIAENPLMLEAVGNLQHSFDPKASETVSDLISNLLTGDSL